MLSKITGWVAVTFIEMTKSENLLTSLSRTGLFKFSFMKRIVGECNSLPLDIREASSVEDFRLKVSTFLTL